MKDNCTYHIELQGQVSEEEINARSPQRVTAEPAGPDCTRLAFSTDQSGLVGLIGYLHGLGFAILSMKRLENS